MLNQSEKRIQEEITSTLKQARISKHLTQQELAEQAGVNSNYYARVERGEAMPSLLTLIKLLTVLDLEYQDVLPKLK